MNQKSSKTMRGFMCHSAAATAVCTVGDARSVIVPRRGDLHRTLLVDKTSVVRNAAKYSRLGESHRFGPLSSNGRSSISISSSKREAEDHKVVDQNPKPTQKHLSLAPAAAPVFQVVVMRVSLHCQGCAGKVKKHLSKMEGVTSFSIDLETKRVTVMGHVSPVGVLESISKVKKAEFWPC
ncbi:hypothetical protein Tsubulata_025229 [Turnera subulata]|uniref:HMA domain-containing protein n=1 Tax=Turnera subulata TaxID=218843 RepID=A0A9Q0F689_9ROSI|nr:hypothetical protein Tsubulata_025229 [Turnera subulata]